MILFDYSEKVEQLMNNFVNKWQFLNLKGFRSNCKLSYLIFDIYLLWTSSNLENLLIIYEKSASRFQEFK